jgi:hypothetical protein
VFVYSGAMYLPNARSSKNPVTFANLTAAAQVLCKLYSVKLSSSTRKIACFVLFTRKSPLRAWKHGCRLRFGSWPAQSPKPAQEKKR